MVIRRFIIALFLVLLPVHLLYAVTADDIRALSNDNDRDLQASQGRAKTSNLDTLVDPDNNAAPKEKKNDKIAPKRFTKKKEKKKSASAAAAGSAIKSDKSKEQVRVETPLPPVPGQQTMVSDAIKPSNAFGIRLGTWMEGSINRNTSNAEPGLVEITLMAEVVGDKKTLKPGTLLFAAKQFNSATKRLEMQVQKGITPDGHEFQLNGLVFDTQKVSGLSGIVDMNNAESVKSGASKGLIAAAGAAAQVAGGSSPIVGNAASATANSILQDQTSVVEQNTAQQLTIYVNPQSLLIRVDQSF
jgi:hypothetical protein